MRKIKDFEERYRTGDLPWDTGRHDTNLEHIIRKHQVAPCPTLEIGAGTGTDAIWLVQQGFNVTAIDKSPTAVSMAGRKAQDAGVDIEFMVADIFKDEIPPGQFDFVFDRGCLHVFDLHEERVRLAEIVWNCLNPEGYWFSLIGSTDGPERDEGPPGRSVLDIASAVEPLFEILSLESIFFSTVLAEAPRAWRCLMRRRNRE